MRRGAPAKLIFVFDHCGVGQQEQIDIVRFSPTYKNALECYTRHSIHGRDLRCHKSKQL